MNPHATILFEQAPPRAPADQFELNHRAVSAADSAHLRAGLHPSRWQRRGVLGILGSLSGSNRSQQAQPANAGIVRL